MKKDDLTLQPILSEDMVLVTYRFGAYNLRTIALDVDTAMKTISKSIGGIHVDADNADSTPLSELLGKVEWA